MYEKWNRGERSARDAMRKQRIMDKVGISRGITVTVKENCISSALLCDVVLRTRAYTRNVTARDGNVFSQQFCVYRDAYPATSPYCVRSEMHFGGSAGDSSI